ncbi:hypothetical protein Sbs19_02330 [Sphingobium sp. BS19]|nr:hypothetical protein Sbs19_02330 [Sphingobium sp. BS19]
MCFGIAAHFGIFASAVRGALKALDGVTCTPFLLAQVEQSDADRIVGVESFKMKQYFAAGAHVEERK